MDIKLNESFSLPAYILSEKSIVPTKEKNSSTWERSPIDDEESILFSPTSTFNESKSSLEDSIDSLETLRSLNTSTHEKTLLELKNSETLYVNLKNKFTLFEMLGISKEVLNKALNIALNKSPLYSQDDKNNDKRDLMKIAEEYIFKELDIYPADLSKHMEFNWDELIDQIRSCESSETIIQNMVNETAFNCYKPAQELGNKMNNFLRYIDQLYAEHDVPDIDVYFSIERFTKLYNNYCYFILTNYLKNRHLVNETSFIKKKFETTLDDLNLQMNKIEQKHRTPKLSAKYKKWQKHFIHDFESLFNNVGILNRSNGEIAAMEAILKGLNN